MYEEENRHSMQLLLQKSQSWVGGSHFLREQWAQWQSRIRESKIRFVKSWHNKILLQGEEASAQGGDLP